MYESSVPCNLKPDPECALSNNQSKPSEFPKNMSGVVDFTSFREEIGGDDIEDYWVEVERLTLYESDRHIILSGERLWETH